MHHDRHPWQTQEPDDVVIWQPAVGAPAVEGPLDLLLFADRLLVLELADDQLAFREEGRQLRQVYMDRMHQFRVGDGPGEVAPASRLFFLRTDVALSWRWHAPSSLSVDGLHLPLRGVCSLRIADPAAFYSDILQGLESLAPETLTETLDTLVRHRLESHLQDLNTVQAQILLSELGAADLDDDLAELGLTCEYLAAFTPTAIDQTVPASEPQLVPAGSYDDIL